MENNRSQSGTSYTEMGIILVILGLVAIGVMTGWDLIRAARIAKITSSIEEYKIVIDLFESKYNALPGDMLDATTVFSGTANGDGDRKIEAGEDLRAWQHLYKGGFLPEEYTGTGALTIDINLPDSGIGNAGYLLSYGTMYGKSGNYITIASINAGNLDGSVTIVKEAKNIDTKMDDGSADSMYVISGDGTDATNKDCVTWTTEWTTPAPYNTSKTGESCRMFFWLDDECINCS